MPNSPPTAEQLANWRKWAESYRDLPDWAPGWMSEVVLALLDALEKARVACAVKDEALETVDRVYYSTQTVPTPGQEAHAMALVRVALAVSSREPPH